MPDALKRDRRKVLKETVVHTCKGFGGYVNTNNSMEVQALAERIVFDLERVALITLAPEREMRTGKTVKRDPVLLGTDV